MDRARIACWGPAEGRGGRRLYKWALPFALAWLVGASLWAYWQPAPVEKPKPAVVPPKPAIVPPKAIAPKAAPTPIKTSTAKLPPTAKPTIAKPTTIAPTVAKPITKQKAR